MGIAENLEAVNNDIRQTALSCGRDPGSVQLVAVSKTRTLDEVRQAWQAGQVHFGENTVQDALTKIPHLPHSGIQWHFIGHLQSKKANRIPGNFQWVHSVDSFRLAQKLSSAMQQAATPEPLNCLLQVNVSGEASKSGFSPDELMSIVGQWLDADLPQLKLCGLMTIGVQGDEAQTRRAFGLLRDLQESCSNEFRLPDFDQLSMGMSNDYRIAIEEGATLVRIGTSIFGQRS